MKENCGQYCGWVGREIRTDQKALMVLAERVAAEITLGNLVPGADVTPSGICPECGAFAYPELPDRATISCCRARFARLVLAGTPCQGEDTKHPGDKAPGSIARTLRKAERLASDLCDSIARLDSAWLDWKHPHGFRPNWSKLGGAK